MFYRPVAAVFAAMLFALAFGTLAKADEKKCVTTSEVISDMKEIEPKVIAGVADPDVAGSVMEMLVKNGVEAQPYDEMILAVWPNGKATIVLFQKGCATLMGSFPAQLLGRNA